MSRPLFETSRRPAVDRVAALLRERDELVVVLEVGEVERRRPGDGVERGVAGPDELRLERGQLGGLGRPVEAADADVDRVHLAAADDRHQPVAELLQPQRLLDHVGRDRGELDRRVVAEEVRRVQEVDVQRVALDPLAAVEEPAQRLDPRRHLDAADLLHRQARAHLVGDRADAADPGGHVGRLGERAPAQQALEEARRLVDPQLHVLDRAVVERHEHAALALDPRQVVGADLARSRRGRLRHGGPPGSSSGARAAARPGSPTRPGPKQPKQPRW